MWIVKLALRRPYTFVVMALLIFVLGGLAISTMSTDIFPDIDIPVVSVIWSYTGISPDDMEKRVVTIAERAMTTTVDGIEHMESQSMNGVGVIKVFFQPNVKIEEAVAEITAIQQTILRVLPPNITPPLIIRYSASSVPVLSLAVSSKTLSEQELYDYDLSFLRQQLATVQGASVPLPYGGKPRQVMVDINSTAMYAKGISPADVTNALNAQNLILPAGTVKIDQREYLVKLNGSPDVVSAFNDLPVKVVNGSIIYMRDVAQIHDGYAVQTNIVRKDGIRGTLLSVLKSQGASTVDIVKRIKSRLVQIMPGFPPGLDLEQLADQSVFVTAAVQGVVKEAAIAACLTAAMILLFLGSWRSTLIIAVSIPLSILVSLLLLDALGYTLNVMTLGGLSLAVGILVDDATVELENMHRNLGIDNKSLTPRGTRWRAANRRARVRGDAVDLHRVRIGGVPDGSGEVSLRSTGAGGGLRHDDQLSAFPHAGAGDGAFPPEPGSRAVPRGIRQRTQARATAKEGRRPPGRVAAQTLRIPGTPAIGGCRPETTDPRQRAQRP